jgi:hypothetical protein
MLHFYDKKTVYVNWRDKTCQAKEQEAIKKRKLNSVKKPLSLANIFQNNRVTVF